MPEKTECMTARRTLWILVFTGMAVNYMIRINVNIAIVGMVRHPRKLGAHGSEECLVDKINSSATSAPPFPYSTPAFPSNETGGTPGYARLLGFSGYASSSSPGYASSSTLGFASSSSPGYASSSTLGFASSSSPGYASSSTLGFASSSSPGYMSSTPSGQAEYSSSSAPVSASSRSDSPRQLASSEEDEDDDTFVWDAKQQGLVLGAFFWLHWLTQLPGGMLAQRFGTKVVYGLSNSLPGIIGFLIPAASHWDYRALLVIRLVQGIIAGCCWPSMHNMAGKWIPPDERSKFVTAYLGSSVGAALTYPLCGLLIQKMGWPSVFYVCGVLSLAWATAWFYFVFDSPAQHPRISPEERRNIEKAIGDTVSSNQRRLRTPWRALLTSVPMWVNVVGQWGGIWSLFTLLTQAPTYFNNVHHWDVRMAGLLSGLPHLCRIALGALVSQVGDRLLGKGVITRNTLRKFATAVCDIGQGLFVLGLAWSGCNATLAVVCLTLATACSGAVSTGPLASIVDMSPNFASIVLGICAAITVLPGFISPYIVGLLTLGNQSTEQWKKVYVIAGMMSIAAGLQYVVLSDSNVQPWNNPMVSPEQQNELHEVESMKNRPSKEEESLKKDANH